jgi:hypothetical protein
VRGHRDENAHRELDEQRQTRHPPLGSRPQRQREAEHEQPQVAHVEFEEALEHLRPDLRGRRQEPYLRLGKHDHEVKVLDHVEEGQ